MENDSSRRNALWAHDTLYTRLRHMEADCDCCQMADILCLCRYVLDDETFCTHPASIEHHHCFSGGLLTHTEEVVRYSFGALDAFNGATPFTSQFVLFVAGVFHDYAKIYDYALVDGEYRKMPYRNTIRHVCGSYAHFIHLTKADIPQQTEYQKTLIDQIGHCILAHHGRQEWGSPVVPQTKEALILHQADMLSASFGETANRKLGMMER